MINEINLGFVFLVGKKEDATGKQLSSQLAELIKGEENVTFPLAHGQLQIK